MVLFIHLLLPLTSKDSGSREYTSIKSFNESKQGILGSLARKAKAFLDDDNLQDQFESEQLPKSKLPQSPMPEQCQNIYQSHDSHRKTDNPTLRKGLGAIASSLSYIGNAVEEGLTIVETRTTGIIQETRKHIRKKPSGSMVQNQSAAHPQLQHQVRTPMLADQDISIAGISRRKVAMAMAAKAKLLLHELKTVKSDLAFAEERCAQLEEENRILCENRERGENTEDDELIRLQLETLLAEKARLAHENSIYARENRFLREVVEYHQLTMQDVVYLDESTEEVNEVYPIKLPSLPNMNSMPATPVALPSEASVDSSLQINRNISVRPVPPREFAEGSPSSAWPDSQI